MKQYSLARIIAVKTLPIVMLLLFLGGLVISLFSQKIFDEQLHKKHEFNLQLIHSKLNTQFEAVLNQVENLAQNELIINGLVDPQTRDEFLPIFFRSFSLSISPKAAVAITDYKGRIVSQNRNKLNFELINDQWKNPVLNDSETFIKFDEYGLFVGAPILYASFSEGAVVSFINKVDIENILKIQSEGVSWLISNKVGDVLFSSDNEIKKISDLFENDYFYKETGFGELKLYSYQHNSNSSAWSKILLSLFLVTMMIVLTISIIIMFFIVRFSSSLFNKLQIQLERVNETSVVDLTYSKNECVEFNNIYSKFNNVLHSLSETKFSKDRIESIINSLNEKLMVIDLDGRIDLVNEGLEKLYFNVFDNSEVEFNSFFNEDEIFSLLDENYKIKDLEKRYSTLNTKNKIIKWNRRFLKNEIDELIGYVFVGVDVSKEKEIALDLKLKNLAIDETVNGVVIVDVKKKGAPIVFVNKSFEKITGYSKEFSLGRNCSFLQGEETKKESVGRIRDAIENKDQLKEVLVNYKKDGTLFYNELMITPIKDDLGQVTHFLGVQNDVTKDIIKNQQLEEAKNKAIESAKLKSEFLANMSHEIRTPMNGVIGILSILKKKNLNVEQEDYTNIALNSANSLLNIINDILDFSKIEAGKLEIEKIIFDPHSLIIESILPHAFNAHNTGVELILTSDLNLPFNCIGDPTRIMQGVNNLVSNALKFSNIDNEDIPRVAVEVIIINKNEKQYLNIIVSDNGLGIPKEKLDSLFDSFTQVDASTTRKFGGTGLGLSIVKQLAQLMNGDVYVESEYLKGSKFIFECEIEFSQNEIDTLWMESSENLSGQKIAILGLSNSVTKWLTELVVNKIKIKRDLVITKSELIDADVKMVICDSNEYLGNEKIKKLIDPNCIAILENWHGATDTHVSVKHIEPYYTSKDIYKFIHFNGKERINNKEMESTDLKQSEVSGKRVLLVEDNYVNQMVALSLLDELHVNVDTAEDGVLAIEMFESQALNYYDLILMDCQMPNLDGYQTTKALKEKYKGQQIPPIVAMTANAMQGDREKCLLAGMDDYLSKPIDEKELNKKVIQWCMYKN